MIRSRQENYAASSYKALQLGLAPELQGLADREIEALIEAEFDGLTAEEVENFAKALKSFGKAAMPVVKQALPGIIQGAATGASTGMVAGPWGALIGGVAGAAAGGIASASQGGRPPRAASVTASRQVAPPTAAPPRARKMQPPVSQPYAPAPQYAPGLQQSPHRQTLMPATSGSQDEIVAATARLLLLLARPEVQNALLALLMGSVGRRSVPTNQGQMPVEAVAEQLANTSTYIAATASSQFPKRECATYA